MHTEMNAHLTAEWALDLDADETLTDAIIREARQFA
jgi:hypothetical protein